ncbi:MAG: hypothetical protein U9Q30_01490 [Campylobacterota bacterium]|nr:hypothetical protein [Campylobacterota bacterium]
MVIIVKNSNIKEKIIKIVAGLSLIIMFVAYYFHMSNKFQEEFNTGVDMSEVVNSSSTTTTTPVEVFKPRRLDKSLKFEETIYKEATIVVDLLEQKHIQSIKAVKNKLLIVCDYDTDLEPLMVRYGVQALIKNEVTHIKIALDLKEIVENRYEK